MLYPFVDGDSSTLTCVSGSGWQSGMSDAVCLAARIAATRAACKGSPFATSPRRISFNAAALMVIVPRARASRLVTGLPPTSTIFTRPRRSTCDSCCRGVTSLRAAEVREPRFLVTVLTLSEIERQALERHRQIDALQLDVVGHVQRAGRE